MNTRVMTATAAAAALMLLVGCGDTFADSEAGSVPDTDQQPVTPQGAMLTGEDVLAVYAPCDIDASIDILEQNDEQVRVRVGTPMDVSESSEGCLEPLVVRLDDPLDNRAVIDLASGEALDVSLANPAHQCEQAQVGFDEEVPGLDTVEEAIDEFDATNGNDFLATVIYDGENIVYDGEVIGEVIVETVPEGGYRVTGVEFCYPDIVWPTLR